MKGPGYLIAAAVAVLASPVSADETWTNVEYLGGKASFSRYMKGTLTLTAKELRFVDKKTKISFSVPLKDIKEVTNQVYDDVVAAPSPRPFGGRIPIHVKWEFLSVRVVRNDPSELILNEGEPSNRETGTVLRNTNQDSCETLQFLCKNKTTQAMVAKIKSQKLAEPVP
jgi:hypothetical protein